MRRRIAPYPTRIAFDYSKIYGSPDEGGPYFLCVGESDIELFVKLLGYAKRRINWAETLDTGAAYYNGLTDSEWETLTDRLDDLEGRLMAVVCVQDLVDAINAMTACVCASSDYLRMQSKELPDIGPYIDDGTITVKSPSEVWGTPTPPGTDPERCEYAQAVYYQVYEAYSEYLFPWADQTSDVILGYLVVSAGFTAVAGMLGLPVSIAGVIVGLVVDVAIDSSIENFLSWMQANKDELICELYTGLPDFAVAASNVRSYVDAAEGISFLDKQLLKTMIGSEWWIRWVCKDQELNGTWDTYLIPGQCDDCEPAVFTCHSFPPCSEGDWWSQTSDPVCHDGRPRCYPGLGAIRHEASTLTPTAASNNRFKLTITGNGGSTPISVTAKFVRTEAPLVNFTFWSGTVNPDETKVIEGTFNTPEPGYIHKLQMNNSPYFVYLDEICIADPE